MKWSAKNFCGLLVVASTTAWTTTTTQRCLLSSESTRTRSTIVYAKSERSTCDSDDFAINRMTSRRQLFQVATMGTVSLTTLFSALNPALARETSSSADPLDSFGAALSSPDNAVTGRPRWPDTTVSPIFPPPQEEMEITSQPNDGDGTMSSAPPPTTSDLEKALQDMQKKKQINPRTHG